MKTIFLMMAIENNNRAYQVDENRGGALNYFFGTHRNLRILVIDDDLDLLKALSYKMMKKDAIVTTVESGIEALEIIKNNNFDLVFLDLKMPIMDGIDTFRQMIELNRGDYVVVMTGYQEIDMIDTIKNLNPYDFLEKPIKSETLTRVFNRRLEEVKNVN